MKRTLFAAATIATFLLCACNKQENNAASQGNAMMTFYGTIEQADTKTVLADNLKVNWEEGDCIIVNGYDALGYGERVYGEEFTATPNGENPTKATFTGYFPMSEIITPPYQAYYPSDLWKKMLKVSQLPANQRYIPGKFVAPMYAESDDENFQFHNLCGVLHFALKGKYCNISSIVVEAVDEVVFGTFSVSNGKDINMAPSSDANRIILQVTGDAPLNSETATNFYVYLPPQTYKAGMKITINNSQGTKYVKTTTNDFVVERSNVYTFNWDVTPKTGAAKARISGHDVDVPWIELWEDGPKFAAYNVGVTDGKVSSSGGYYNQKNAYAYTDRTTEIWGANWRTPTKSELQGLLSNCTASEDTVDGICGTRFTGKGVYSVNSIFLPYNFDNNGKGKYASSTPITDYSCRYYAQLYVSNGRKVIESSGMYYEDGTPIRAVAVLE